MSLDKKISTLGLLGIALACSAGSAAAQKKMNVLFIAVDDFKPTIKAYGDPYAITPNIDRLASSGATFSNCYVQQAISGATRASIMTGMRPDKTKVWDLVTDFRQVNPNAVSIPQHFVSNGYNVVARGKIYHVASAGPGHDAPSWNMPYDNPKAPVYALTTPEAGKRGPATECADVADDFYADGKIANEGVELIKKLAKEDKPFFLAVGFFKPHLPFVAPKKYWDLYKDTKFEVAPYQKKAENSPDVAYHTSGELKNYSDIPQFDSYSEQDMKHLSKEKQLNLIKGYYAASSYTDANIGKLLDALHAAGLDENTIVVLWGDHGWHLGDHGLWCKHTDFENSTHVPLIVRVPGEAKGVKPQTLCEFVDVFPTLCDAAGVPTPTYLDGVSLKPALSKPDAKLRDYSLSQYPRPGGIMGYTIRTDRYRYTEWLGEGYDARLPYDRSLNVGRELYDYAKDPLETRSRIGDADYAEVQAQMEKLFEQAMNREHSQYVEFEKLANYQKPISTSPHKKGRADNQGIE